MTSVVLVDTGGTVVEYVAAEEDPQQVGCTQTSLISVLLKTFFFFFDCLTLFPPLIPLPCRRESVRWTWSLKET